MFNNPLKTRLAQGLPAVGHWISFPSPGVAELLASFGMDWLVIDAEHGPASWETAEDIIRAMKGTEVVPIIRVEANDPALVKRALDRGAYGVIIPFINTAEEAQAAVAACKYPPEGIRGVAGGRANRFGADLGEYFSRWNSQVVVICQIETTEALSNVDEIAATPGVDVLFVGPNDLSAALGAFRKFDNPEFVEALERVVRATKRYGIAAGYMGSNAEDVLQKIDQGFRFIAAGSDTRLLAWAAGATYDKIRSGLKERKQG